MSSVGVLGAPPGAGASAASFPSDEPDHGPPSTARSSAGGARQPRLVAGKTEEDSCINEFMGRRPSVRSRPGLAHGLAWVGALSLCCLGLPASAFAPPAKETPRDPNDLPPLPPPNGQPRPDTLRLDPDYADPGSLRRRFQFTLLPTYAALDLPFLGRTIDRPLPGGGLAAEFDVELYAPFFFRVTGSYTAHPVEDEFTRNDDEQLVQTAAGGHIQVGDAGVSLLYAMDTGRLVPMLDVGLGALWLVTPDGVQSGQMGQQCREGGVCDSGLVCAADNVCRQGTTFEVHAGLAIDVLLGDRWAIGAHFRYFALLTAPAAFPIYLHGALRLSARF